MDKEIKSTQEQAIASWIDYLNQVRLNQLMLELNNSDLDFKAALKTLNVSFDDIQKYVIERNRGGQKGMHGFIAEIAETGIENARRQVVGKEPIYEWINDNGPADLLRNGNIEIQQKFVESGGVFSLNAIKEHLEKYPDFIRNGGKYQVPSDFYKRISFYMSIPEDVANKMQTSEEFSLRKWKEIHNLFGSDLTLGDLEPSALSYDSVQKDKIAETFSDEKNSLKEIKENRKRAAYENSQPSLSEGLKVTAVSAGIEGLADATIEMFRIRKSGKKFSDFSEEDWNNVASKGGFGVVKGGVRGASIYLLTNCTAAPAAVASSLTTAAFGVAQQVYEYRNNNITETALITNCEMICVNASVSALSSMIGQALIPVPVLGAVIGNTIGTVIYSVTKDQFEKKENQILMQAYKELQEQADRILAEYDIKSSEIDLCVNKYICLITGAFSPDIQRALDCSVALAVSLGVDKELVLDSQEKIDEFFMG